MCQMRLFRDRNPVTLYGRFLDSCHKGLQGSGGDVGKWVDENHNPVIGVRQP